MVKRFAPDHVVVSVAERKIQHTFRYKPAIKTRAEQKLTIAQILEQETKKAGNE